VIIDGGTTALALARALPAGLACTAITHSPIIAAALVEHPAAEVLILGGRVFKHSAVTCGALSVEGPSRYQPMRSSWASQESIPTLGSPPATPRRPR
jgi:DeoR/GlpR family transcriptional regulator of sugar metabolism